MKKILIVTPRSPFQGRGADEQDRLEGIKWFIKNGFEVRVITKVLPSDLEHIEQARKELGIKITPVSYKFVGRKNMWKRLVNPKYWDGAAYEYFDTEIQEVLRREVEEFDPEIGWFDYTYLWPLYHLVKKAKIITRSINFEPTHFLDEDGWTPLNLLRAVPKLLSEIISLHKSNWLFAITPKEEQVYKKLWSKSVSTLPLRDLPSRLEAKREYRDTSVLKLGYMSSTYSVSHNIDALLFLIQKVLPLLSKEVSERVEVHITGNRLPDSIREMLPQNVIYDGFVPSSVDFWTSMDIAVVPSLFGSGMQQKIFEPLALGVPTITSSRGLAGYLFIDGESVVCASSAKEFAQAIEELATDSNKRRSLGEKARGVSLGLFDRNLLDKTLESILL